MRFSVLVAITAAFTSVSAIAVDKRQEIDVIGILTDLKANLAGPQASA